MSSMCRTENAQSRCSKNACVQGFSSFVMFAQSLGTISSSVLVDLVCYSEDFQARLPAWQSFICCPCELHNIP
jgi:hypothetical protein